MISMKMIAASNVSTPKADKRVILRNAISSKFWRFNWASRKNVGMSGVYSSGASFTIRRGLTPPGIISRKCVCTLPIDTYYQIALPSLDLICDFHAARINLVTAVRQRNIVKIRCQLAAVAVCPVKELQYIFGAFWLILRLVDQDKRCASDRPAILAGFDWSGFRRNPCRFPIWH